MCKQCRVRGVFPNRRQLSKFLKVEYFNYFFLEQVALQGNCAFGQWKRHLFALKEHHLLVIFTKLSDFQFRVVYALEVALHSSGLALPLNPSPPADAGF